MIVDGNQHPPVGMKACPAPHQRCFSCDLLKRYSWSGRASLLSSCARANSEFGGCHRTCFVLHYRGESDRRAIVFLTAWRRTKEGHSVVCGER